MADPVAAGGAGGAGATAGSANQPEKQKELAQDFSGKIENTGPGESPPVRITSDPASQTSAFRDAVTGEVLPEPKVPERIEWSKLSEKLKAMPELIQPRPVGLYLQHHVVGLYEQSTRKTFDPMKDLPLQNSGIHVVEKGDNLADIAYAKGMKLDTLIELNPQITNPAVIQPGDFVFLRGPAAKVDSQPTPKAEETPVDPDPGF